MKLTKRKLRKMIQEQKQEEAQEILEQIISKIPREQQKRKMFWQDYLQQARQYKEDAEALERMQEEDPLTWSEKDLDLLATFLPLSEFQALERALSIIDKRKR